MPQSDSFYSTTDLSRKPGDIIAEALRHPVTITLGNKPRLVLLNIEDYERLLSQSDHRMPGTIETMVDALFRSSKAPSTHMLRMTKVAGLELRLDPNRTGALH